MATARDAWDDGAAYEPYIGRWSRLVAAHFLQWLAVPAGGAWLDVGCGTGALSEAILSRADPHLLTGCDRSRGFVEFVRAHVPDKRARFVVAELSDLPQVDGGFDAVVSGLVINFLPDPLSALRAMAARVRGGGVVAGYVWDYAERMQLIRLFWDAAVALDPAARDRDEGVRFPLCQPDALSGLWEQAGLADVRVAPVEVPTVFRSFDDYWQPFVGGVGPAPGYACGLPPEQLIRLREAVRARLPTAKDGSIPLVARAWAARGTVS
jgi:SAM-dependent methyltransferase